MGGTLILRNDGTNFEKIYYQAVCMGDLRKAERLYEQYNALPAKTFWRDAFRESGLQDTVLMSSIVNLLDMPFGSYAFLRLDDDVMEIAPWLYAESANRQGLIDALARETEDAQTLYAHSRTLHLTADYLAWLKTYHQKKGTEGSHA